MRRLTPTTSSATATRGPEAQGDGDPAPLDEAPTPEE
jgi:hypothetical protein